MAVVAVAVHKYHQELLMAEVLVEEVPVRHHNLQIVGADLQEDHQEQVGVAAAVHLIVTHLLALELEILAQVVAVAL
jgi:hypothetical protein